tara:strand:- start:27260 stop:28777 length:1518 start_codon:yes stop_codon:yes gene_type:complete
MQFTILDCYTDEPSGLGVPPYLGTYPRYITGALVQAKQKYQYITIDDLRFYVKHIIEGKKKVHKEKQIKTDIKTYNLTKHNKNIRQILEKTNYLIIIAGEHTPGKYLSAIPGTTTEVKALLSKLQTVPKTILTGPAVYGSGLYGGGKTKIETGFDYSIANLAIKLKTLLKNDFQDYEEAFDYKKIQKLSILGAELINLHPSYPNAMLEIETAIGCSRKNHCSFCLEPVKHRFELRDTKDIIAEIKALSKHGAKNFRLGKQSDFFSRSEKDIEKLLKNAAKYSEILHIDNINPANVTENKVKLVVKYCTEGNIAALGQESFDKAVIKANNLNSDPETTYKAIKIINKYGVVKGENGMSKFLPGINLLFGLIGETKDTHKENMKWLTKILDNNLLLRRINIRQVAQFPQTKIFGENKAIRKNKKYYWKWRNEIRQNIDVQMLKRLVPTGTILVQVQTEIYDGNTTFTRQLGTYPLVIGIKERLPLNKFYKIKITKHMLRSVTGEVVN